MIRVLDIPGELLKDSTVARGSYTSIAHSEEIERLLEKEFGRTGLCLKIYNPRYIEMDDWKTCKAIEEARIQNLFALFGLAPMVYRVVLLKKGSVTRVFAQVTEYAQGNGEPDYFTVTKLIEMYHLQTVHRDPSGNVKYDFTAGSNWIGEQFVDFGGWYFKREEVDG